MDLLLKSNSNRSLPVGVVLTIPPQEVNPARCSGNLHAKRISFQRDMLWKNNEHPSKVCYLNPELTFTLTSYQTAVGLYDIMSHVMERYFTSVKNVELTDRLCEATLKTVINNAPILMKEPKNYDARAEIMWAGSIAHNDLLGTGRQGDFMSHMIEHELSGIYDIAHGAGLSIVFPAWMKYVYKK